MCIAFNLLWFINYLPRRRIMSVTRTGRFVFILAGVLPLYVLANLVSLRTSSIGSMTLSASIFSPDYQHCRRLLSVTRAGRHSSAGALWEMRR